MGLHQTYQTNTQNTTATTAKTYTFNPKSDLVVQRGVVGLLVVMTVVQFQHLVEFRIKVNSDLKVRLTPAQLRLYFQRFSKRYPSAAFPADAALTFVIPFWNLEYDEGDPRRYMQQLEPGPVTFEIDVNATPGAGTLKVAMLWADEPATHYFEFKQFTFSTVPASSDQANADFNLPGYEARGYIMNTTGITKGQLMLNDPRDPDNVQLRVPHDDFDADYLIGGQILDDGSVTTNPICRRFTTPVPAMFHFELQTGVGWAGPTNVFAAILRKPVAVAKAG